MGKIVLLGSDGFVGKNICEHFTENKEFVPLSSKDCNLLDFQSVTTALDFLEEKDTIIFIASITRLVENSLESMNKNILMVQNVLKKLSEKKVKQIIFFSSIDVYGLVDTPHAISEHTPFNPADYYATSKVVSEYLLQTFCSFENVTLTILRPSGIYGRHDYKNSTVAKIVSSIIKEKKAHINGDGSIKRDYICVDDIINVLDSVIESRVGGIYNMVSGHSISIKDLMEKIFSILGMQSDITYTQNPTGVKRAGDLYFDNRAARENIPKYNPVLLDDGLKKYIELFRSHNEN